MPFIGRFEFFVCTKWVSKNRKLHSISVK
jgi:hypothetical protein